MVVYLFSEPQMPDDVIFFFELDVMVVYPSSELQLPEDVIYFLLN